jgi:hypothetical protein
LSAKRCIDPCNGLTKPLQGLNFCHCFVDSVLLTAKWQKNATIIKNCKDFYNFYLYCLIKL